MAQLASTTGTGAFSTQQDLHAVAVSWEILDAVNDRGRAELPRLLARKKDENNESEEEEEEAWEGRPETTSSSSSSRKEVPRGFVKGWQGARVNGDTWSAGLPGEGGGGRSK